jgi:hypothetical protein
MENEELETQETSNEPANEETQETLDKIPEYVKEIERKNAQLFERTKKAEAGVKELREMLSKQPPVSTTGDADVDKILEIRAATKDLDDNEVVMLRKLSKVDKISLSDARNSDNFAIWQKGYKQKVEMDNIKNNVPPPSTTQSSSQVAKDVKSMSYEERQKLFRDMGLTKSHKPPEVKEY